MKFERAVPLAEHSTMRLGGQADYLVHATTPDELIEAYTWAKDQQLPAVVIGGGSNIVWTDEGFRGLVIINDLKGLTIEPTSDHAVVTIGAGENWDQAVEATVKAGLSGIEALSLIPGSAGATPIQNVGAYGQEIATTLEHLSAYDTATDRVVKIPNSDCQFGYRTSRFKTADKGRFLVISITLTLAKTNPPPPYYSSVEHYFETHQVTDVTPTALREAVIAIRSAKLPDPGKVANCGSFFANPIVPQSKFDELMKQFSDQVVPHWPAGEGVKLSAAWLIEQAGLKDYHDPGTGMATWPTQPLVFINEAARSSADLFKFRDMVAEKIKQHFNIELVQEPETMPSH